MRRSMTTSILALAFAVACSSGSDDAVTGDSAPGRPTSTSTVADASGDTGGSTSTTGAAGGSPTSRGQAVAVETDGKGHLKADLRAPVEAAVDVDTTVVCQTANGRYGMQVSNVKSGKTYLSIGVDADGYTGKAGTYKATIVLDTISGDDGIGGSVSDIPITLSSPTEGRFTVDATDEDGVQYAATVAWTCGA